MNEIKLFEGNEVKVKTDEGKTLINLVHVAKYCGLTYKDRNIQRISWKNRNGVVDKVKKIYGANAPQEILDEIENTDDRNTIYISSWLAKRLAVECRSESEMKFKNFLVSLDESRENNQSSFLKGLQYQQFLPTIL